MEEKNIPTRQVKMLMVEPAQFMALFTKGLEFRMHTKIVEGLPEDAKLVTVTYDSLRNAMILVVESKTYKPIPVNEQPPIEPIELSVSKKVGKL